VRQQENIKVELAETGWEGVDWDSSGSGQRQVADCCELGKGTSSFNQCGEFLD